MRKTTMTEGCAQGRQATALPGSQCSQLGVGAVNTELQGLVWPPRAKGCSAGGGEGSRVSGAGQKWKDLRGELKTFLFRTCGIIPIV